VLAHDESCVPPLVMVMVAPACQRKENTPDGFDMHHLPMPVIALPSDHQL
jgi:hypothetical protein